MGLWYCDKQPLPRSSHSSQPSRFLNSQELQQYRGGHWAEQCCLPHESWKWHDRHCCHHQRCEAVMDDLRRLLHPPELVAILHTLKHVQQLPEATVVILNDSQVVLQVLQQLHPSNVCYFYPGQPIDSGCMGETSQPVVLDPQAWQREVRQPIRLPSEPQQAPLSPGMYCLACSKWRHMQGMHGYGSFMQDGAHCHAVK